MDMAALQEALFEPRVTVPEPPRPWDFTALRNYVLLFIVM